MACLAQFAAVAVLVLLKCCFGSTILYMGLPCGELVGFDVAKSNPQWTQHYRFGRDGLEVVHDKQEQITLNYNGTFLLTKSGLLGNFSGRLRPFRSATPASATTVTIVDGLREGSFTYNTQGVAILAIPAAGSIEPTLFMPTNPPTVDAAPYIGYTGDFEIMFGSYSGKNAASLLGSLAAPGIWLVGNGIFYSVDVNPLTGSNFYVLYDGKFVPWSTYQSEITSMLFRPRLDCSRSSSDESDCRKENSSSREEPSSREDCGDREDSSAIAPQTVCVTKTETGYCTKVVTVHNTSQQHLTEIRKVHHMRGQRAARIPDEVSSTEENVVGERNSDAHQMRGSKADRSSSEVKPSGSSLSLLFAAFVALLL